MPYQTAALNDQRRSAVFSPVSLRGFFSILIVSLALIGCSDKKIIAIAAGFEHTLALDKDGKVYATGWNGFGLLGLGNSGYETSRKQFVATPSLKDKNIIAIAAGTYHSLALDKDGKVYATGDNNAGQLGLGDSGHGTDREVFTEALSLKGKKIIAIDATGYRSLALDSLGNVYATGLNKYGQLGLGDSGHKTDRDRFTAVSSFSGRKIIAIAAGTYHSLALDEGGKVYATGDNNAGQLGLGDSGYGTDRKVFTEVSSLGGKKIIAIAAGGDRSLALDEGGKVYAAGDNDAGKLGVGDKTDRARFTEVSSLKDKNIIAIAAGYYHSLALDKDGKVYAVGYNQYGQLGLGDKTDRDRFVAVSSLGGKKIIAIVAGIAHSFAIDSDGKVYAAGYNVNGQLGLGDKSDRDEFAEVEFNSTTTR